MPSDLPGWSPAQRRLHGWTAGLVALGFVLAWAMTALPFSQLLAKFLAYQAHKTVGLVVLGLVVWRLWLRARRPAPAPLVHPRAAAWGHRAIYALLLAMPLLGYLTAQLAPGPVPTTLFLVIPVPHMMDPDPVLFAWVRPVHQAAAWLLVGLATGHAGMALLHHRRGLPLLSRMWR